MERNNLRKENEQLLEELNGLENPCEFKKIGLLVPLIGIICGILVQFFI